MSGIRWIVAAAFVTMACAGSSEPTSPEVAATVEISRDTMTTYPGFASALPAVAVYNASHTQIYPVVTWASADTALAKINGDGTVEALSQGVVDLIASAGAATARVHLHIVREPVAGVHVNPMQWELTGYDSVQLYAWVTGPANDSLPGRIVTLRALDPSIVTVSSTGMVHVHASGNGRVEATSEGISDTATFLTDARVAARITFSPDTAMLIFPEDECDGCIIPWNIMHTYDALGAELFDRPAHAVSSDTSVVRINSFGGAQLVGVGTATVTVRVDSAVASYVVISTPRP